MDPVELKMQRHQLDAWRDARPTELVLTRPSRVKDGVGGWTEQDPVELDPQKFRIVVFKRRLTQFMDNIDEGEVPNLNYTLVGYPDADIEKGDMFTYEGNTYTVVAIDPDHEIRKVAVARFEGDPTDVV